MDIEQENEDDKGFQYDYFVVSITNELKLIESKKEQ